MTSHPSRPLACVLGDMDLVRPLGLAGVPCAVAVPAGAPPRFSRFVRTAIPWADSWEDANAVIEALVRFGAAQPAPPVLFYEEDGDLLLISRYRHVLSGTFRFVIPPPELVEQLVDKARFQALAREMALPVPRARCLAPDHDGDLDHLDLRFPVIVKPLTRRPTRWAAVGGGAKATRVDSRTALRALWPRVANAGMPVIIQELIPGAETAIESYHVYVDERGTVAAEFTGRKVRTYPAAFGDSTALTITDARDVAELGRELVGRLGLVGVAKFDFKRAPDGRLFLLEINPRFTLWHHLGAVAGVNIPALVYSDLAGLERPRARRARAGASWCRAWQDVRAARETRMPMHTWLRWALACDAKSAMAWDDPLPLVGAVMWRALGRLPQPFTRLAQFLDPRFIGQAQAGRLPR